MSLIAFQRAVNGTFDSGAKEVTFSIVADPGEVLLAAFLVTTTGVTVAPDADTIGWEVLDQFEGGGCTLLLFRKRCFGSEIASNVFAFTYSGSHEVVGVVVGYRANREIGAIGESSATASASHTFDSIDIARADSWAVAIVGGATANSWTAPAGFTERADRQTAVVENGSLAIFDKSLPGAGELTATPATMGGAASTLGFILEVANARTDIAGLQAPDPPGGIGLLAEDREPRVIAGSDFGGVNPSGGGGA